MDQLSTPQLFALAIIWFRSPNIKYNNGNYITKFLLSPKISQLTKKWQTSATPSNDPKHYYFPDKPSTNWVQI
jgi:hypothetical protein